ncbi:TIGR03546 family protein [Stieleria sp. TO1_6]|uniref:TIGR03546 family protein n=1 Tax=Stieleria tagensis TaxID=2956795 RepID=UPI00209BA7E0|nr:TIGR03546 family protein [Stieleria tagensis]MCO8122720.1 TIGR03546 family protein [Stieleria tagensis]
MVLFSLKLFKNLRKAIAGRRFPHQLAGGVALGVLLGIIPHGNLLALLVLLAVLCFRVNHALLGVVAILASFVATQLDHYSHAVGQSVLTHPTGSQWATKAWAMPLVPWTDLNNTVVLGSFLIGLAAVLPIFAITLPVFRLMAPADLGLDADGDADGENCQDDEDETDPVASGESIADPAPIATIRPRLAVTTLPAETDTASEHESESVPAVIPIDRLPSNEQMVSIETRIDVIRMADSDAENGGNAHRDASGPDASDEPTEHPNDEALNYLLHQLRHSQQRKAAG